MAETQRCNCGTTEKTRSAVSYTARELVELGKNAVPDELVSNKHFIYSSPATLAFNSPGAEGFGVKRAALAIPGSVMLLVAPGCCGRNTSLVSSMPEYHNRFFYLQMDETDIVTGRHLKRIPDAVKEVVEFLPEKPSIVMICITCVDALLGTDMERVCRKAEEAVGIPVKPSYMYALTREGRNPPMVHVRQSLYSLLKPMKKKGNVVNLLGYFAPLCDNSELYTLLQDIGVKKVNELSRCKDYDEYMTMAEANFNLVLNWEARFAARDFEKNLKVPSIELTRFYEVDRIAKQYKALGAALGVEFQDESYRLKAKAAKDAFVEKYGSLTFAVGECLNADPFELALALIRYGLKVSEVYGTVTAENWIYIQYLADLAPDLKIFSNLEPTMIYYDCSEAHADVTIGKDAGYYHAGCPNLPWNSDRQPYGYQAVWSLFEALDQLLSEQEGESAEDGSTSAFNVQRVATPYGAQAEALRKWALETGQRARAAAKGGATE